MKLKDRAQPRAITRWLASRAARKIGADMITANRELLPNVIRFVATNASGSTSSHVNPCIAFRRAGRSGAVKVECYYTTGIAAKVLGITAHAFRDLMDDVRPADSYHSRAHGKSQWCALWSISQVHEARHRLAEELRAARAELRQSRRSRWANGAPAPQTGN